MCLDNTPSIALPDDLSDKAAARLLEFLYELARVVENHYAAQIRRYYQRPDERQIDIGADSDPPF